MVEIITNTIATPLKEGDEVITVAVSSEVQNESPISEGLKVFEEWGLVCRPQKFVGRHWGYLAGDDKSRQEELHQQPTAPLIAFAKGGWGAARLLEQPQPWSKGFLLGYSDVSSILLSRLASGFDGGVHGPLVTSLSKEPDWSKERLKAILFGGEVPDLHGTAWGKGIATGPLIVANLTVATHLIGSKHFPDIAGSILVLEDTGEAPYRIDRMLTQWRLTGKLQTVAGIAFGNFSFKEDTLETKKQHTFLLEEILRERCFDLGIPLIANLPIGHCQGNASLPMGRHAVLDGNKGSLSLITS